MSLCLAGLSLPQIKGAAGLPSSNDDTAEIEDPSVSKYGRTAHSRRPHLSSTSFFLANWVLPQIKAAAGFPSSNNHAEGIRDGGISSSGKTLWRGERRRLAEDISHSPHHAVGIRYYSPGFEEMSELHLVLMMQAGEQDYENEKFSERIAKMFCWLTLNTSWWTLGWPRIRLAVERLPLWLLCDFEEESDGWALKSYKAKHLWADHMFQLRKELGVGNIVQVIVVCKVSSLRICKRLHSNLSCHQLVQLLIHSRVLQS